MRVGILDIGTNSVRLLVADRTPEGLHEVKRALITTRLGAGLINTGLLSAAGKKATLDAVLELRQVAMSLGVRAIRALGTSALREACDGREFASAISEAAGLEVEILSAEEEARLSYAGTVKTLSLLPGTLVFDLGGGSCEIIQPDDNEQLIINSLKIGAVYLKETFLHHDPPLPREVDRARCETRCLLAGIRLREGAVAGVGGTVTSLAAMVLGLEEYIPARIHGFVLSRQAVVKLLLRMLALTTEQRAALPGIQPSRADILPAGALVVDEILDYCRASCLTVSEGDLLVGALFHQH